MRRLGEVSRALRRLVSPDRGRDAVGEHLGRVGQRLGVTLENPADRPGHGANDTSGCTPTTRTCRAERTRESTCTTSGVRPKPWGLQPRASARRLGQSGRPWCLARVRTAPTLPPGGLAAPPASAPATACRRAAVGGPIPATVLAAVTCRRSNSRDRHAAIATAVTNRAPTQPPGQPSAPSTDSTGPVALLGETECRLVDRPVVQLDREEAAARPALGGLPGQRVGVVAALVGQRLPNGGRLG